MCIEQSLTYTTGVSSSWFPEKLTSKNTFVYVDESEDDKPVEVCSLHRSFSKPNSLLSALIAQCDNELRSSLLSQNNDTCQTYATVCTETATSNTASMSTEVSADAVQQKPLGRIFWCHERSQKEEHAADFTMLQSFCTRVECFKKAGKFDAWLERHRTGRHTEVRENQKCVILSNWREGKPLLDVVKKHLASTPAADSLLINIMICCESKQQYDVVCRSVKGGKFDLPVHVCQDFGDAEKLLQKLCSRKRSQKMDRSTIVL